MLQIKDVSVGLSVRAVIIVNMEIVATKGTDKTYIFYDISLNHLLFGQH